MENYKYTLERYTGRDSRHTCPACGRPHCFTFYVDAAGNPLAENVGKCDHLSKCGYHKTPAQHFAEHPERRHRPTTILKPVQAISAPKTDFIPLEIVQRSQSAENSLMRYLLKFFDTKELHRVTSLYRLGSTQAGEIIYTQLDTKGRCRTGKIMAYGEDGHRVKEERDAVDWLHNRYRRTAGAEKFSLNQCLFGEHLLTERPNDIVCLVEAEKTAVVCYLVLPQFVWVAVGGRTRLNPDLCRPLAGRSVIAYADADAAEDWQERIKRLTFCRSIKLSDWHKDEPDGSKRDVADLILQEKEREQVRPTTIGDLCAMLAELGIKKPKVQFNL